MKYLKYLLPLILFACNDPVKSPDQLTTDTVVENQVMRMAAVLPSGQQYDILLSGDSNFYKTKDTTVFYPVTYKVNYIELHKKGTATTNQKPIAIAGNDFIFVLPGTFKLDGTKSSDPDGSIVTWVWRYISGPSKPTITDSNKAISTVSNIVKGQYEFELRVVDNLNAVTVDRIIVTVNESTTPPVGTPISFSFTQIPFSDPDFNAPGRGAEQWHNFNVVNIPSEGTNTQRLDVYYRSPLTWAKIEKSKNNYDWSPVINMLNGAIGKKQKVTIGLMSVYHDNEDGVINYDGGNSAYPLYLHQEMQSESVKDWKAGSGWVPNYNSAKYLDAQRRINTSLNNLLETGSFNGVRYKDVINSIDVRGYGNYGEWHNGGIVDLVSQIPAAAHATTASLKAIIDAHTQTMPNFQLSIIMTAFDANWLQHTRTSAEVAYYALTTSNAYGKLGWRRDNWGATDNYIRDLLENNTRTWNGVVLNSLIMNVWKYAPVTGEPMNNAPNDYGDMERQVRLYHALSFGNGNIFNTITTALKNNIRAGSKASGYRIISTGGTFTPGATSISVTTNWQNVGISPTYESWDINYELVNSSGAVTPLGKSTFKLRLFLPATTATAHTDVLPMSVPAGSYTLRMVVKDPTGYRAPLVLAIQGKNSDNSYNIKTFSK